MSDPTTPNTTTPAPVTPAPKKKRGGRKKGATALTVSQKAEAATLWRMGEVTLQDLSKKFGKRPETFSRLFKEMGIKKGSGLQQATQQAQQAAQAKVINDAEVLAARIAKVKEDHIRMSDGLAKIAWAEIVRCRQANLDLAKLKDLMQMLKLAGEVVGRSREELYALLQIEDHDKEKDPDELPDLTVRELTPSEITQLQNQEDEDLDNDLGDAADLGGDMLPSDEVPGA